jgi:hypothetical protein
MAEPERPDDPAATSEDVPWDRAQTDAEPEPDWAGAIREGRKARGERLKEVFASFEDDDPETRPPV